MSKPNAATIEWFGIASQFVIITCNDCGFTTACNRYDDALEEYISPAHKALYQ